MQSCNSPDSAGLPAAAAALAGWPQQRVSAAAHQRQCAQQLAPFLIRIACSMLRQNGYAAGCCLNFTTLSVKFKRTCWHRYGFIVYTAREAAERAVTELAGRELDGFAGRKVNVGETCCLWLRPAPRWLSGSVMNVTHCFVSEGPQDHASRHATSLAFLLQPVPTRLLCAERQNMRAVKSCQAHPAHAVRKHCTCRNAYLQAKQSLTLHSVC